MSELLKKMGKLIELSYKQELAAKEEEESKKGSQLRGGSCGALVGDKVYSAKCARLDQARLLGVQKDPSIDDLVAFSAGFGHETRLSEIFKHAGLDFKKEQEYEVYAGDPPLKWSGRPDFEIKIDGEWVGVEAKALISPYSVHKQQTAGWPYMRHMIQAAAYQTMLQRPLWLISIGHYFFAKVDKFEWKPSIRWYQQRMDSKGRFYIHNGEKERRLPFVAKDVRAYYLYLYRQNEKKQLCDRPFEFEIEMKPYNRCNYCDKQSDCNAADVGQISFDTWMSRFKTAKGGKNG